jgi:multidrug resistance protein, MATE family
MQQYVYHFKKLTVLAFPIFIGQLTQTMMGFIDTAMAGQVSAQDMAAVAIGAGIWFPTMLFVLGLIMPLTPIVSHYLGGGAYDKIRPAIFQGFYLALLGCVPALLIFTFSPLILNNMQLEPGLFNLSKSYLYFIAWGAPAFALFQVLRSCSEGIAYTMPTMLISFVGLACNIPANYIFIHGHFGIPALGGAGCGLASALVYWCMLISMGCYIHLHPRFERIKLFYAFEWIRWRDVGAYFRLGLPIALSVFFEVTLFSAIALFIAPLGSVVVAGHQIAMNFSSLVFMLPLSIGIVTSIRVGYYLGRQNPIATWVTIKVSIVTGMILAVFTAIGTFWGRQFIAYTYTQDSEVINLAIYLLMFAALYQIVDAIQTIIAGALRGYKDTTACFYISFFSYWVVGMPLGYLLSFTDLIGSKLGVLGFWIGISIGLTCAAVLFSLRLSYIQRRTFSSNLLDN